MTAPTDHELTELGVSRESLFDERKPKPIERWRPFGANLLEHWEATDERGQAELALEGRPERLQLAWRGYRLSHGLARPGHLGSLHYDGAPIRLTEDYVHVTTTNSGTFLREGLHVGDMAYVSELIRALDAGQWVLAYREGHRYAQSCAFRDDVVWHDVDWHRAYVHLEVDFSSRTAQLRRIRLDDSSQ